MLNPEIYLDLDGVLNQWLQHEVGRRLQRDLHLEDWPVHHGWDIVSAYNELSVYSSKVSTEDFWATVPEESWTEAPKSEIFDLLIPASAMLVGRENVHIITTVPPDRNPAAYSGKAKWCAEHLPEWLQKQVFITTHDKSRLARRGRLLIDDADHNIYDWEANGGQTIQIPRPWSRNWQPGRSKDDMEGLILDGFIRFQRDYCG